MSTHRLVAIGIDSPSVCHFEEWLASGRLPNISKIAAAGTKSQYSHVKKFRNERCWTIFQSGSDSESAGATFVPESYSYYHPSLQRDPSPMFYELGEDFRVCAFDMPARLSARVNGVQVSGWGSEFNASLQLSDPPDLLAKLIERHGVDPKAHGAMKVFDVVSSEEEHSYRNPNLYDVDSLRHFACQLEIAVQRRTEICLDLLNRESWDLFLTVFVEGHTANHMFWNAGRPHPFRGAFRVGEDPMMRTIQAIDDGIGKIARSLSDQCTLVVYTIDDTGENLMDLPSMALLPELLYRWNFPDRRALRDAGTSSPVPRLRDDYSDHWKLEVWRQTTDHGRSALRSPQQLEAEGEALNWNPAIWYQGLWPQMSAFALPSVADGHIRINLAGREANGLVDPADFETTLQEVEDMLSELIDPRDGTRVVERCIRVREDPYASCEIPPDLIVCWRRSRPFDTVDSSTLGRVGPLPFFRTGGHKQHGETVTNVLFARGPGLPAGV
ncbi:MAG TPA: hypothetical protein DHW34_01535 [Actinobacteria bacterium]|nr:hypothetical protein [Actinomycetota bacterium]